MNIFNGKYTNGEPPVILVQGNVTQDINGTTIVDPPNAIAVPLKNRVFFHPDTLVRNKIGDGTVVEDGEEYTDIYFGGGGGGGGGFTWDLSGDSGTTQTINSGDTVDIEGGNGISTAASATDKVTVTLDNTAVTAGSYTATDLTVDAQGRLTAASSNFLIGTGQVNQGNQYEMAYYATTGNSVSGNSQITTDVNNNLHILSGNVYTSNGSASAPAYSFGGDTNTGMYRHGGGDVIGFSTNGTEKLRITNSTASALLPTLVLGADPDTGFYNPSSNQLGFSTQASEKVRITNSNSAAAPTLVLNADTDTGLYTPDTNSLGITTAGEEKVIVSATNTHIQTNQGVATVTDIPLIVTNQTQIADDGVTVLALRHKSPFSLASLQDLFGVKINFLLNSPFTGDYDMGEIETRYSDITNLHTEILFSPAVASVPQERGRISHTNSSAEPTLVLNADADTGFYNPAANQLGVSAGGTEELRITSSHVSSLAGSATNPSYNFGLAGTDINTGMYRVQADVIGLSTGGQQKVTIVPSGGLAPIGMINGLNVGTTLNVSGINRICSNINNSWEDGDLGNSTQLVFIPSDFMVANPTMSGPPRAGAPALTTAFMNLAGNGQSWLASSGGRYAEPTMCTATPDDCLVATKIIPKGFIIKDEFRLTIFGIPPTTVPTFNISLAYRQVLDLAAPPSPGNVFVDSAYALNNPVSVSGITGPIVGGVPGDVVGDGISFLILYIQPGQQLTSTDGGIRGAILEMARY